MTIEHKIVSFTGHAGPDFAERKLNELGAEGWELVAVHAFGERVRAYLKRGLQ